MLPVDFLLMVNSICRCTY